MILMNLRRVDRYPNALRMSREPGRGIIQDRVLCVNALKIVVEKCEVPFTAIC